MRRIAAFTRGHLIALAYVFLAAGLLFYAYRLEKVATDTNRILQVEVQEKDQTIKSLNYIVKQQATPAIVYLLGKYEEAGLKPPKILLGPNQPPFTPPS